MARQRFEAAKWAVLIDEWRRVGLSRPAFCKQRDLSRGTMQNWVYKPALRRAVEGAHRASQAGRSTPVATAERPIPPPAFLPVRLAEITAPTPEFPVESARRLLASFRTDTLVGLRDRAVIGTLIYTAVRVGAVARLRVRDFAHDGSQWMLRFAEKGGKSREIPVRHDLERFLLQFLDAAGLSQGPPGDPVFRTAAGRTGKLTDSGCRRSTSAAWSSVGSTMWGSPAGSRSTRSGSQRSPTCSIRVCRSTTCSHTACSAPRNSDQCILGVEAPGEAHCDEETAAVHTRVQVQGRP